MLELRFFLAIIIAYFAGKLITKLKLPAILGWLITGMVLGPHAVHLINMEILDTFWFEIIVHILECCVGLMIGSELVWKNIKKFGKQIIYTTFTQSLGTFFFVTLVFGILFYFMDIPLYLAAIFGGIALATAPAPALSIVREFKTKGPLTNTLIPMAALDDMIGVVVFFSVMSLVISHVSTQQFPFYMILFIVFLPVIIGIVTGILAGLVLKKERKQLPTLFILLGMILVASFVGFFFNWVVMPKPVLNFMIIGMAFSAAFSNMVSSDRLNQIMISFGPVLNVSLIVVILNLGAPLDYHLIFGAGLFTAVYIISRAIGKYMGAYFGAKKTNSPPTVVKYLGLTLLPHSGVSLVFTGIAVNVLSVSALECANIIQGTIAAAALINEVLAVILAKKGFEWAGECQKNKT